MADGFRRGTFALFGVALFAAVLLAYRPAWHGDFIWDDDAHVTRPELRSGHGLRRIWFEPGATQQYYPLLHSAFWIEQRLWGDSRLGYHLLNIGLHAVAALLVVAVLRRLPVPGAYLAGALFAVHPVHVESVAWIAEQKNTLSAVFYLGAAWLYLRYDQTRRASWYLPALGLFGLALLTKSVTATLPAALLVVLWWQRGRLSWRRDVAPLLPWFVLGAAAGLFTAWVERKLIGAEGVEFHLTVIERGLLAGRVVAFYLAKLVWPAGLMFSYPRWRIDPAAAWQYLFPAAVLVLLGILWWRRGRGRGPLAGLLFFVGTLFPVLGFFNVYPFRYSFVADHFQYLASLGVITPASAAAVGWLHRWRLDGPPRAVVVCLPLLITLAVLTYRQSQMYADVELLYQTTLARNPDCWMAHNNLGTLLAQRGRKAEAVTHLQAAIALKPDHAEAHSNLGLALQSLGRSDEAIAACQTAIALKSDSAAAHFNLANVLGQTGRGEAAIRHYQEALRLEPDYLKARVNLGIALLGRQRVDEAIDHFQKAVDLRPDHLGARQNLGVALFQQGRAREALDQWRVVLRGAPDRIAVLGKSAWTLATHPDPAIRNGVEAVALAERAVQLTGGNDPAALDTLAAAYAEAGRFPESLAWAQRAADQAAHLGNAGLADAVRKRMQGYQTGTPYRDPESGATARPQRAPGR